jgi:two-component system, cell cycle response regulator
VEDDGLFSKEDQTVRESLEIVTSNTVSSPAWPEHYRKLLKEYEKLLRQTKRLVKMGDSMQKELAAARETAEFRATHDFLTRLLNRAAILELLDVELSRSFREKSPLTVIMIDIDHFKNINDQFGHLTGDAVLGQTAERLRLNVRRYDSVGRFGGEEFLVVAPGVKGKTALGIAERLRLAFSGNPITTNEGIHPVTLSLGVATKDEHAHASVTSMIRGADDALYRAKKNGRNRIESLPVLPPTPKT